MSIQHTIEIRVRYGETDQMNTFYNAVALDWFEVGRTETMRAMGVPYTEWENRGVYLPLVEARVFFKGRANYDDLLTMTTTFEFSGKARVVARNVLVHQDGSPCAEGYTVHAMTNAEGRAIRPPQWVKDLLSGAVVVSD